MPWLAKLWSSAVCDRCGAELEEPDTGSTILFDHAEPLSTLGRYDWHTALGDDGEELICVNCWEHIGAEDATIAKAAAEAARWDQTGPDLISGRGS